MKQFTPATPARSRPAPGDVVISRIDPAFRGYVLSRASGPSQVVFDRYVTAVAAACRFAERTCVDVWLTSDSFNTTLVACHRDAGQRVAAIEAYGA